LKHVKILNEVCKFGYVLSGNMASGSATPYFGFGDFGGAYDGDSDLDWIRYNNGIAKRFAPVPILGTIIVIK